MTEPKTTSGDSRKCNLSHDHIVVGLGAMGSSTLYNLAKNGASVLGLDSYNPPHIYGSSHDIRLTRLATAEGSEYAQLALRSHQLWRTLENESGFKLLTECGGLIIGRSDNKEYNNPTFIERTIRVAEKFGISHSILTSNTIKCIYPQFNLTRYEHAYFEATAGYLNTEKCIKAHIDIAKLNGAEVSMNEKVIYFEVSVNGIYVITNMQCYKTKKLILTVGPWIKQFLPQYSSLFKIYRQTQYWFSPKDKNQYNLYKKSPIFVWSYGKNPGDSIYGFPAIDGPNHGLKVSSGGFINDTSMECIYRSVTQADKNEMYKKIKNRLLGIKENCVKANTCLYTVSLDKNFIIDFLPDHKNVILASACNGHGFKHSAAIGEILMELALYGKSRLDISSFSFNRLIA